MSGGMNSKFVKDPLKFINEYAIAPPDDVAMYRGEVRTNMPTTASNQDYEFARVRSSKKVAWLNFFQVPKRPGANLTFMPLSETAVTFSGHFTKQGKRHVPAYFLPWNAGGAIIRLTIPRLQDIQAGQLDSPYFFTATITGCSIFIKGTPDSPTIYHAGGETGENDPTLAAQFWANLMQQYSHRHGAIQATVDKTDYIRSPRTTGGRTTVHAQTYEQWLQNANRTDLDIQFVEPWGCVMGLRDDAGDWTFYLQENATVYFYKLHKQRGGGSVRMGQMRSLARPIAVKQVFPGTHTTVLNFTPMPKVL